MLKKISARAKEDEISLALKAMHCKHDAAHNQHRNTDQSLHALGRDALPTDSTASFREVRF
ncbi:hypothetical protein [Achromobacter animicus]|uniref:hypothetical protein n=1 Tax=Achromobacter animicus TaxID=1389935 RepID=UPI00345E5B6B